MSHLQQQAGIFGIGSAQGIDALGWSALEHLRPALAAHPTGSQLRWHACRAPVDMLPYWEGLTQILLLDALPLSGAGDGLRWLTAAELDAGGALSSHGLGIGEAVELAAALGLCPRLSILELVVDPDSGRTPADWLAHQGPALTQAVTGWLRGS